MSVNGRHSQLLHGQWRVSMKFIYQMVKTLSYFYIYIYVPFQ